MNADSGTARRVSRLRERLKGATSDAILEAAEHVFAEQGVHAARMEDIAAHAGVSVGTLYNYFADRGALFSALLELRRTELIRRLDEAGAKALEGSFESELENLFRTIFEHFEKHRPFLSIVLAGEHVPDSGGAAVSARDTMRALYARFEEIVDHGLALGTLSRQSSELYPALLMGMARGVLMRSLRDASLGSTAPRARELTRLFITGAGRSA